MGIDMYVGLSRSQVETLRIKALNRNESYKKLMQSVSDFMFNTPKLTGVTYTSAKEYAKIIILPIIKGAILIEEKTLSACKKLIDKYEKEVCSHDLREEELVDGIEGCIKQIDRLETLIEKAYARTVVPHRYIWILEKMILLYEKKQRMLENLLLKLRRFNQNSEAIFTELEELQNDMQKAIKIAKDKNIWNSDTKEFEISALYDMSWVSRINERYDNREQWEQDEKGYRYKVNGKFVKGWQEIDGNFYYFDSDEYMETGWKVIKGKRYYFKTKEDADKTDYKNAYGYMWTGWRNIDNNWYYFKTRQDTNNKKDIGSYGYMLHGWNKIDEEWFYMRYDGKLVERSEQYIYDDSQIYYIDKYGVLVGKEDEKSFTQRDLVLKDIEKEAKLRPDLYGNTDFISSQRAFDKTLSTFGLSGNINDNGCGSIAMYNVLHGLGENISYKDVAADIVNESNEFQYVYSSIEDNEPTNMGGTVGLNPGYIKGYLNRYGYKVNKKSLSEVSAEGYDLKSHAAYISMYFWFDWKHFKLGAHYEALIPNENSGLDAYNINKNYKDFSNYNNLKEKDEGSFHMEVYEIDR